MLSGIRGACNGHRIIGHIDLSITRNRVIKLLNPGKTKGAAAFCVTAKLRHPSDNGIYLSRVSVASLPVRRQTELNVNCLTRRPDVFHGLSITSGVHLILRRAQIPTRSRKSQLQSLLGRFHLRGITGALNVRMSKKRQQQARLTQSLTSNPRNPGFLFLSRPFTKMSPVTITRVRRVMTGLHSHSVNVLVASRGIHRALHVVSHTCVVDSNRVLTSNGTSSLTRGPLIHRRCLNGSFTV